MGFNASYTQIQNKRNIDSDVIANVFIKLFKKEFRFIEKKHLTYQAWKTDKNLFCIAITPITCFDLSGWDNDADKNWTLITFSHYQKEFPDWESALSEMLNTTVETAGVYDTSNQYSLEIYKNGKKIVSKSSEEICYTVIQYYVARDFFELTDCPNRINVDGEQYLIFQSKEKTFYINPKTENDSYNENDFDDDIPF